MVGYMAHFRPMRGYASLRSNPSSASRIEVSGKTSSCRIDYSVPSAYSPQIIRTRSAPGNSEKQKQVGATTGSEQSRREDLRCGLGTCFTCWPTQKAYDRHGCDASRGNRGVIATGGAVVYETTQMMS
ncbi:unnamed protein product [Ectocarpus sp. 4 AP-2014]